MNGVAVALVVGECQRNNSATVYNYLCGGPKAFFKLRETLTLFGLGYFTKNKYSICRYGLFNSSLIVYMVLK